MITTRTIKRAGRTWWIQPAAAEPLLATMPGRALLDAPRETLDRTPDWLETVKVGRGRAVLRFQAPPHAGRPARAYFVKAYTGRGLLRRLRAAIGLGPGRHEWDALLAAREAGLHVPEPVALARGPLEVLVTREVPGERLDTYLFGRCFEPLPGDPPYPGARPPELVAVFRRPRTPPQGTIDPRALAVRLARLVAQLAEADLYLPDLHPGNILVDGPPGHWRLALVDLADAVRPAPDEAVLRHLAQLEHFFEPIAPLAERLRCHQRATELLADAPDARAVARATAVYRDRFYRRRDRRTHRPSKYFQPLVAGRWRGWAAADAADDVRDLLARGDPADDPRAADVKRGRTGTVWQTETPAGRHLFVKRHNLAARRAPGRPSRSLAAFRKGHALLVRGIATARPVAAVDRRAAGRVVDTLLLTEAVPGGQSLSDWLRGGPAPRDRRRLTRALAHALRRMHDASFAHRDLKAPNVLVAPAAGPDPRPWLVDLDGLRRGRHVSPARRARDLMRLSVSLDEWDVARATDRLRFLRAYLSPPGCPRPVTTSRRGGPAARRLRRWWRRIARASARKAAALRRKSAGGREP